MRGKGSCGSCYCSKLECSTHGLFRCASQCGPHLILCPAPLPPLKEAEEEKIERSGKRLVGKKRKKKIWKEEEEEEREGSDEHHSFRWTSLFCETHNNMFLFPVDQSMYDLCHQRQLISIHQGINKGNGKRRVVWHGGAWQNIPHSHKHMPWQMCVFTKL